jgi:eukaryotic-like serine/threonine-protein kinase
LHFSETSVLILVLLASTIAAVFTAAPVGLRATQGTKSPETLQLTIVLPAGERFTNTGRHLVAMSPDGTRLVYVANNRLYMRTVGRSDAALIAGVDETGGGSPRGPFFSPDGHSVGFWQNRQLKKISLGGGPPVVLCAAQNPQGATWTVDGILFAQGAEGIWRVPTNGGTAKQVIKVDGGQQAHGPQLLPGGRAVLFTLAHGNNSDTSQTVVQSLENGTRRVAVERATDARYVPTGHIVYARSGALLAVPFDIATLESTGRPVQLVEDVAQTPTGVAQYAIAANGVLAYVPKDVLDENLARTLVWVDRQGVEKPINVPARWYFAPRLSPDATRVALEIDNDIWILDLTRRMLRRLTADRAFESVPIWTPDGRAVIFSSGRSGRSTLDPLNLFRRAADGTGYTDRLTAAATARQVPYAVTIDGTGLVFREHGTDPSRDPGDIMLMSLVGRRESRPLVQTTFREMNAELSPDGRWVAFQSNESGRDEIYVRPFPNVGAGRWQVSAAGGTRPLWARNGQELFYESARALMRVPVTIGSTFEVGTASKLFGGPYFYNVLERMYDVSPDGQRFLMIKEISPAAGRASPARIIVLQVRLS